MQQSALSFMLHWLVWPSLLTGSDAYASERLSDIAERVAFVQLRLESLTALQVNYSSGCDKSTYFVMRNVSVKHPFQLAIHNGKELCSGRNVLLDAPGRWPDGPDRDWIFINRDYAVWEEPLNRRRVELPLTGDGLLPAKASNELLFLATGLWPCTHFKSPRLFNGAPSALAEAIESGDHVVKEHPDTEHSDALLLEHSKHDRIWISPSKVCILRREILDPKTGAIAQKIECARLMETSIGVHIPRWMRNTVFPLSGSALPRGQPVIDAVFDVSRCRINEEVEAESFAVPTVRPGTVFHSIDKGTIERIVPGGMEHMDGIRNWILRDDDLLCSSRATVYWLRILDFIAGIVGGIIIACQLWRRGWRR